MDGALGLFIFALIALSIWQTYRWLTRHGGRWLNSPEMLNKIVKLVLSVVIGAAFFYVIAAFAIILFAWWIARGGLFR